MATGFITKLKNLLNISNDDNTKNSDINLQSKNISNTDFYSYEKKQSNIVLDSETKKQLNTDSGSEAQKLINLADHVKSFNPQVLGFVGVESCEMICYMGRILYALGKNVLFADCSEYGALMECVPEPHFPENPDLTNGTAVLEHRGMEFLNYGEYNSLVIEKIIDTERLEGTHDFILVDFGFKINHEAIKKCNALIMCCNQHMYNIRRLSRLDTSDENQKIILVVKDFISESMPLGVIQQELKLNADKCQTFCLPYSEIDSTHHLKYRYPAQGSFKNYSKEYKENLAKMALMFTDEMNSKTVMSACKDASLCKEKLSRRRAC